MKRTRILALAAVTVTSCAVVGPTLTTDASATTVTASASPSFYSPPSNLPAQDGTLIRSERFWTGLSVWGNATRIMYKSTDSAGDPVAVTGVYIEPWGAWSGPGPRPLTSFSVGTIGQGDNCAPSKLTASAISISGSNFGMNYELPAINNFLAKGVGVVVTDYVGLGTPDRVHSYMNRVDQGHAVLDAARAVRSVPGASVTAQSRVATYGYSQGGGASAAANELQAGYAPDVNLVASYAGAPPADLMATLEGIEGSAIAGVMGYFINGVAAQYPQAGAAISENLDDAGRAMLAKTANQCIGDTLFSYGFKRSSQFTKDGRSLAQIVQADPQLLKIANDQKIGTKRPSAPVRIATGVHDDVVPHGQARQLAVDWCAKGGNVTYAPITGLDLGDKTALNHLSPMPSDALPARDWVVNALKGQTPTSNCASVPAMR